MAAKSVVSVRISPEARAYFEKQAIRNASTLSRIASWHLDWCARKKMQIRELAPSKARTN